MRFSEDDHDIGTIALTVIMTLVLGVGIYAYHSTPSVQTAFEPTLQKTVPTIVPSTPRF
jgi:hypothetical protein